MLPRRICSTISAGGSHLWLYHFSSCLRLDSHRIEIDRWVFFCIFRRELLIRRLMSIQRWQQQQQRGLRAIRESPQRSCLTAMSSWSVTRLNKGSIATAQLAVMICLRKGKQSSSRKDKVIFISLGILNVSLSLSLSNPIYVQVEEEEESIA